MARQFTCVNPGCGRDFQSSDRFVLSSKGLCPNCLKNIRAVPCHCEGCGNSFLWYQEFAETVGHPVRPQKLCPTCADKKAQAENPNQPVVAQREALMVFPAVRINMDMEGAVLCDPQRKAKDGRNAARRLVLKDRHGKSYTGRLDVYDYRPNGARGFGSLARVRVMRVTHAERPQVVEALWGTPLRKVDLVQEFGDTYEYVVLEPVNGHLPGGEPAAALVVASYHGKSALKGGKSADGGVNQDSAFWSVHLTSSSRTGGHWGGTVVGLVDDEHPLIVRQDNCRWRFGLQGRDLEEPGFRESGLARLTLYVPNADAELVELLDQQGFKAKLVGRSAFVRLKWLEDVEGFILPDNLPEFELRVESMEAGGGYTNTGWAQIACALDGTSLRPFATARHREDLACGEHGWFSAVEGIATVQACLWSKEKPTVSVELTTHNVVQEGNTVQLVSETLFKGAPDQLPFEHEQFRQAVHAAANKALDYHCRRLHYAQ
jgi:hypothetical protein